jgi:chromosome partitioning protein
VHLAAHGLTLWDMASTRFERDVEQWQPLVAWLDA